MIEFEIRQATNEDAQGISRLIFDIWKNEYQFKVNHEDAPDLHEVESYYINKGGNFLVALFRGEIIGTIACDKLKDGIYILKRMNVHKDFRGQGVAQCLLDELLTHKIVGQIYLSTNEDMAIAAKKFYLRNGFDMIQSTELPHGFPFFLEDNCFMRRELAL